MGIEVSVVEDNIPEILFALEGGIDKALKEMGLVGERHAKKYCPVDTGRLRNSITHDKSERAAYIGTNVEYGPYVELGTSKMKAQPYLKPAVENHQDEYKAIVKKNLQNA